jgi:hypothetical protein
MLLHVCLLSCLLAVSHGYSSGPPSGACASMQPGAPHRPNDLTPRQQNNPPFTLEAEFVGNGQVKGEKG